MYYQITTKEGETFQAEKVGSGAYAEVFKCEKQQAYKVFKAKTSEFDQFVSLKTFEDQCRAYIKLKNSNSLAKLVPDFYGIKELSRIENLTTDISSDYALQLCYSIEFIESIASTEEHSMFMKAHKSTLHNYGILYTEDCEIRKNKKGLKMIDFGTKPILERVEELCDFNESRFDKSTIKRFNQE